MLHGDEEGDNNKMNVYRVQITADVTGRGSIIVGDHDVSDLCGRFTLAAQARNIPALSLDLMLRRGARLEVGAVVEVSPANRALLEALGWTAPPGITPIPRPTFVE